MYTKSEILANEEMAFRRLEMAGLTIEQAMRLPDSVLLSYEAIGRKTLRVIRLYQGPIKPYDPRPTPQDFTDEDGYVDWEDYDQADYQWRQSIPSLYESWCPQSTPKPEEPQITLADILGEYLN